jgi:predicted choloylglycine hydrolase
LDDKGDANAAYLIVKEVLEIERKREEILHLLSQIPYLNAVQVSTVLSKDENLEITNGRVHYLVPFEDLKG